MNSNTTTTHTKLNTQQMALVGLMTAVTCILAPISLVLPFSPVPLSLGTFAIYLSLMILGRRLGTLSVMLYLLLGLAGLPVFTGFTGGAGKLLGPTGGYLIGYLFLAFLCGTFVEKGSKHMLTNCLGMVPGTLVCYLFGTLWLAYQSNITFTAALVTSVLPFLPGDLLKITGAVVLGHQVRKRLLKNGIL